MRRRAQVTVEAAAAIGPGDFDNFASLVAPPSSKEVDDSLSLCGGRSGPNWRTGGDGSHDLKWIKKRFEINPWRILAAISHGS